MKDELNKIKPNEDNFKEIEDYAESKGVVEEKVNEAVVTDEFSDNAIFEAKPKTKKSDSSLLSKISSSFMITAVAATTVVLPVVGATDTSSLEIKFSDAYVTDSTVSYVIEVSDATIVDLDLVLVNNFTSRRTDIIENVTEGVFEELAPKMEYSLQIVMPGSFGSEKVLAEMKVKTLSEEDYKTARFNGVMAECKCNEDGFFHFTMDYVDNLFAFQNFVAYLEDENQNRIYCDFNGDLHTEQLINVDFTILKGNTATLVITCDKVDGQQVENIQLFKGTYSI